MIHSGVGAFQAAGTHQPVGDLLPGWRLRSSAAPPPGCRRTTSPATQGRTLCTPPGGGAFGYAPAPRLLHGWAARDSNPESFKIHVPIYGATSDPGHRGLFGGGELTARCALPTRAGPCCGRRGHVPTGCLITVASSGPLSRNNRAIPPARAATCGQRVAICGVTCVNTPAYAGPHPCALLITAEKPQAGSLEPSAPVAQGTEQRFPKPCVAGSIPAGGTACARARRCYSLRRTFSATGVGAARHNPATTQYYTVTSLDGHITDQNNRARGDGGGVPLLPRRVLSSRLALTSVERLGPSPPSPIPSAEEPPARGRRWS